MTHRNRILSTAWLSVVSVGVAMVGTLGCAPDATQNAETNDVGLVTEALNGKLVSINYKDDRPSTFFSVAIVATDQSNGKFVAGNLRIPGQMVPGSLTIDDILWTQGDFSLASYSQNNQSVGFLRIFDQSVAPHRFTTMRLTVQATINGACHTDYEDIDLSDFVGLFFNGEGASWNGSCWVGDLLHH